MNRRTLLQWMASAAASAPLFRVQLFAQPRELGPDHISTLREVAATVLPASLGAQHIAATVDRFVEWTRGYREGVPLVHGYGHTRIDKTGPSPVPRYVGQLAALDADAKAKGKNFPALDLESRRALLDEAITKAGVKGLPPRPNGQHVASDLMAFYFRSSEAADRCYHAQISRQICRPIAISTKRPAPLKG